MAYFGKEFRVRVNVPTSAALLERVRERLRSRRGFALATLNMDHLVKLADNAEFRVAYAAHDLIVADGNPIVWTSRLARKPVELIPGSDSILPLSRIASAEGINVALVGSTEDTLSAAKTYIEQKVEGLRVVRMISPGYDFDPKGRDAKRVFDALNEADIGMCFVALGAPKQEMFAAEGRRYAPSVGFVCVGAGLDFLSGAQERAPLWVRRIAMEWAWRMVTSPRRLVPRYAQCLAILPGQIRNALSQRAGNRRTA